MTVDWLAALPRLCRGHRARSSRSCRREPSASRCCGAGEGGDDTTAIDAAAEDAVVARLEALDADFLLVSEELGERAFGAGGAAPGRRRPDRRLGERQARDPVLLALPRGRGTARRWATSPSAMSTTSAPARSGWRSAGRRPAERPPADEPAAEGSDRDPLLRGDDDRLHRRRAPALLGVAERLRVMGSLALSLCHLAAGRVDAVCSLKAARSIDIAAAQLLVRERGYAIELFEDPPFAAAPLDLDGPLARRRGRHARALRHARRRAPGTLKGRLCRPFMLREVGALVGRALQPASRVRLTERARASVASPRPAWRLSSPRRRALERGAFLLLGPAPRTISARMMKPMPLSSSAIPTIRPNSAICSAM